MINTVNMHRIIECTTWVRTEGLQKTETIDREGERV